MGEMVERVARAMAGDSADMPWTYVHTGAGVPGKDFVRIMPWWRSFEALARAAIEAMREPTEGMCKAAVHRENIKHSGPLEFGCELIWRAMIDEALR